MHGNSKSNQTQLATAAQDSDEERSSQAESAAKFRLQLVMLDPSLKCKGIQLALLLFGDSWIPHKSIGSDPPHQICIQWLRPIDVSHESILLDIEGPVPKGSLALS